MVNGTTSARDLSSCFRDYRVDSQRHLTLGIPIRDVTTADAEISNRAAASP